MVVARSEEIATEAKRSLAPYRRTQWLRDHREASAWFPTAGPPLGVVIEANLGISSGLQVLAELRALHPLVPALLLAVAPTAEEVERGYKLRASHLTLPLAPDALMPFAFRALTEEIVADERVGFLVEALVRAAVLTLREAELLVLVIGDMPREKIIERMAISDNTLKGHVRQLLRKLEAGDLDKLAARVFRVALQNGGTTSATVEATSLGDDDAEGDHESEPPENSAESLAASKHRDLT